MSLLPLMLLAALPALGQDEATDRIALRFELRDDVVLGLAAPAVRERVVSRTLLRRPSAPGEMAGVAAFLASDGASFMTGQTLYVDGGKLVLYGTMPDLGGGEG